MRFTAECAVSFAGGVSGPVFYAFSTSLLLGTADPRILTQKRIEEALSVFFVDSITAKFV